MAKAKVFIDGEAGTTGLQIAARLSARDDLELLQLDEQLRKDSDARRDALNASDISILCLPDSAARESVAMVDNVNTKIIDASTAHRTAEGWVYGFPEYSREHRDKLKNAMRVANPGCYAIASVAIIYPLIRAGLLPADWPISINGVSGYSGGGKALIAAFEDETVQAGKRNVYDYALSLSHKHVPEITRWSGLGAAPIFLPSVGRYYKGMLVRVPLPLWALPGRTATANELHEAYCSHYADESFVTVAPFATAGSELNPEGLNDTNELRLHVLHNAELGQVVVVGQLDNLGKGASGQVVQTLNLMLGVDERRGLQ